MNGYQERTNCSACDSTDFQTILDLGVVPLAGYFPNPLELDKESKYPLKLVVCKKCKLVQTDSMINPKLLFEDYRYLSSIGLSKHLFVVTQQSIILNDCLVILVRIVV